MKVENKDLSGYRDWLIQSILARQDMICLAEHECLTFSELKNYTCSALTSYWETLVRPRNVVYNIFIK